MEQKPLISVYIKTLITPEAHERLEDELVGFLYSKGIEAEIENSVTGNSMVSTPKSTKVDEEGVKEFLKEYYKEQWEEMNEQGTLDEFASEFMDFLEQGVTNWLKDVLLIFIEKGEP